MIQNTIFESLRNINKYAVPLHMRYFISLILSIFLFGALVFSSCSYKQQQVLFQQQQAATVDTTRPNHIGGGEGTSDYRIKSQDILQIRNLQSTKYIVDDQPTTGGTQASSGTAGQGQSYQVEDDGTVALPVIGHVTVAGLTRTQAAKLIEDLYRKNVLKDPIIDLKIINLKVTMLGEIKAQGNYPLVKDKTTLIEMIGEAGGLTDKANEKTIKIIRGDPKNPQVTIVDLSKITSLSDPRLILQNNDIIYIAQNKRAIKNDQIQNLSTTLQPVLIILNTALIIYALIKH
ncbi:MAG: polysaccharide biosynthesis/export family protein [Mucilaginibacter sp.]